MGHKKSYESCANGKYHDIAISVEGFSVEPWISVKFNTRIKTCSGNKRHEIKQKHSHFIYFSFFQLFFFCYLHCHKSNDFSRIVISAFILLLFFLVEVNTFSIKCNYIEFDSSSSERGFSNFIFDSVNNSNKNIEVYLLMET